MATASVEPLGAPRNLKAKRSTDNSYIPMALTADLWARDGKAVKLVADAFVVRINTVANSTARSVTAAVQATNRESHGGGAGHRGLPSHRDAPPVMMSGLPNPQNSRVGRG